MYALTLYSNGDLIYVLKGGAYLIYGYSNVAMFCLLFIAALIKLYRKRVHINSSLADDYFYPMKRMTDRRINATEQSKPVF